MSDRGSEGRSVSARGSAMWRPVGALLLAATLLAGCATTSSTGQRTTSWPTTGGSTPTSPPPEPFPGAPAIPPVGPPRPLEPVPSAPPAFPRSASEISGEAVVALLDEARKNQAAGQFDMAAANLQRALRIEPRNYFLWSALASVYLDQHQYDQAQTIALKSNSLAHGNLYVELKNWQTIAAARQANGDNAGALQAHGKVDEIQRQLPSG